MTADAGPSRQGAALLIAAGVCAALHVGKLSPAVTALQQALSISLVEAGFLLSLVQFAGMAAGLALGALADALGLRRSMLIGLVVLALASALGGTARSAAMLMLLRAAEGIGFLLVVLPAPALIRQTVPPQQLARSLGWWSTYMPLATALALLAGPWVIGAFGPGLGWRVWWWALAALTAAMALAFARASPVMSNVGPAAAPVAWALRLRDTLGSAGPWLVALTFASYSAQWLAVIGFLPTIYEQAGVAATLAGAATALVAAVNIIGNVGAGRLLHRGVPATRLLGIGFAAMALGAALAFSALGLPVPLRYAAVLLFSAVGGIIPGTLFALAVRLAPGEHTLSSTVGWMQQWSAFGQFCGPPLVAWAAARAGGWQWTWLATGACALLGLALSAAIARRLRAAPVR